MYFSPSTELGIIKNKTGYEANDPKSKYSKVSYFEVIAPLKWSGLGGIVPDLIPIGSLTWCYNWSGKNVSIFLEDNRYGVNFHPNCFRFIKHECYGEEKIQFTSKNTDKEYRFKTKSEFIDIGKWNIMSDNTGYPSKWASGLEMNHYLGKLLTKDQQEVVKNMLESKRSQVIFDGWTFFNWDFIELKPEYVSQPREMQVVERVPDFPKAVIYSTEPVQQVDWSTVKDKPSLSSTFEQTAPIIYESKKEELNDDIVIESTINITI